MTLPEARRLWLVGARPGRLLLAFATMQLIAATFAVSARVPRSAYELLCALQALVLLTYGGVQAAGSIVVEKQQGTWDLQRLTPQSSGQLFLGKLLGAPALGAAAALFLTPWILWLSAQGGESPAVGLDAAVGGQAALAAVAFLTFSLTLLGSAFSEAGPASPGIVGAVVGFLAFSMLGALRQPVPYFGWELPPRLFFASSCAVFGLWAAWAAKWRIGRDLMEPAGWGRLPAFLVFLLVYQLGFARDVPYPSIVLPCLACLGAAALNPGDLDAWKAWRAGMAPPPAWVTGLATCLVLAGGLYALGPRPDDPRFIAEERFPLLFALFLARDLLFLQWCRLTGARRPEAMALLYIGLAYFLPSVVTLGLRQPWLRVLFAPVVEKELSLFFNLLPGLGQAAAAGLLALGTLQRRLRPNL